MKSLSDGYILASGAKLPCVGYGTWRTPPGDICVNGVITALQAGYRHIDTAAVYENEESVGEGIIKSGVPREEVFLTSKLWNTDQGKDRALKAFELSLKKLKTGYLDLYLIHWPVAYDYKKTYPKEMIESWHVLETLYKEGRVKAIGVSNFLPHHMEDLLKEAEIAPMVNQIELHPGCVQTEAVDFCRQKGIVLEAWSPLCKARVFDNPTLLRIAAAHGKTPAQVLVRWSLQMGFVPLPKSVTPSRIIENAAVFDFGLTPSEMSEVTAISDVGRLGSHPDRCNF
ncbi:MAG: aldo/keto reductase [Clostridiales bacterium]|jgi:diketogulonate reductase-like aldo/keto reductase|nr:aldo/keto reductase [Clostridiales bacterium]HOK82521.1 aldo/keto reductase [Clostridia bacterium]HOL61654.1 aldo/keto reductase [Clostridia bacterium]HPO54274.1 aldo/keto reductase [Clostridia bacterium]